MRRLLATFAVLGFVLAATTPTLGQPATSLGDTSTVYLGGGTSGNQWTGAGATFGNMPILRHVDGESWVDGVVWAENGFDIYVPTYSTEWNTTQWPYAGQATGHNFPDYDHYGLLFDTRSGHGITAYQAGKLSGYAQSPGASGDVPGTWDWVFSYYGTALDGTTRENAIFYGTMESASLDPDTHVFTARLLLDDSANGYHGFETHTDATYPHIWSEQYWNGFENGDFDRELTVGGLPVIAYDLTLQLGSPVESGSMTPVPLPEASSVIIWSLLGGLAITVGLWRRRHKAT